MKSVKKMIGLVLTSLILILINYQITSAQKKKEHGLQANKTSSIGHPKPPIGKSNANIHPLGGGNHSATNHPPLSRVPHSPTSFQTSHRPEIHRPGPDGRRGPLVPDRRPGHATHGHYPPTYHYARYSRRPYEYGGHRYYAHNNYYYHPYRPYSYGPYWHPAGFFIAKLAVAAAVISIENAQYRYYQGVYYAPYNGGYRVVAAPIGATITDLPPGYANIDAGGVASFYYGGSYYVQTDDGYQVIAAPEGAIVNNLPDGAVATNMAGNTYMLYNGTYYQPIQINGQNAYEVVKVE